MAQFCQQRLCLSIGVLIVGALLLGACAKESAPEISPADLRSELGQQRVVHREGTIGVDYFHVVRVDGSEFITITSTLGIPRRAALSIDGSRVVYECDSDLCIANVDTGNQERLLDVSEQMPGAISANRPAFSPDGQRVVFTGSFPNAIDLYTVNVDSSGLEQVGEGVYSDLATYSPDGKQIVFNCEGRKIVPAQICVMDTDGTDKRLLTDSDLTFWTPRFTPDGQHIVVSAYRESFLKFFLGRKVYSSIYTMNADGSDLRQLTSDEEAFVLTFSADGKELVYLASDGGNGKDIYVMNSDGSNKRRLGDDWWDVARRGGGLGD